jgi:hypothetical protein
MSGLSLFLAMSGGAVVWFTLKWVEKVIFIKMVSRLPQIIKGEFSGYFNTKGGENNNEKAG